MKFLFYSSETEAQQRCDKAFIDMENTDPNTTAYAIPEKHPTNDIWSVAIDEKFEYLFTAEELLQASEKDETWIVKMDLINKIFFNCPKCNIESKIIKINERYICVCDKCNTLIYSKLTLPK